MSALLGQPAGSSRSVARFGDVVLTTTGAPTINTGGGTPTARWVQGYTPTIGDAVAYLLTTDEDGQSSILALGQVAATPTQALADEARVTMVPPGSATITVTPAGGTAITAKFVGAAPAVGDTVLLDHRRSAVYVVGKVGVTPEPEPAPEPPPPPPPPLPPASTGTTTFAAIDSGTARVGAGWDAFRGQNLFQGTYSGVSFAGAWFYGTGPQSLAGDAVTGSRVFIGARRQAGAHGSPVVLHLYAHTSPSRPGGDVSRVLGPHDVTIPAGWGGDWVDIPTSFAAQVIAGGGIGIAGGGTAGYASFEGRLPESPQSGTLAIDWAI